MVNSAMFNQLHDIHLPAPIGWWPPALGWIVVILFLTLFLMGGLYYRYQSYSQGRAKRQALHLLEIYQQEYMLQNECVQSSAKISELLRRVALAYYPRAEIARLSGQAWVNFLNKTGKKVDFSFLHDLPYQRAKAVDLSLLFSDAKTWIKQRKQ